MDLNSAVIHALCRKELASQREDYEMSLSALMHQRNQLRKEKESLTQQRNTLEGALEKCRSDMERLRHERDVAQQIEKNSRAKSKNEISRLREALSSIQSDRDQQQSEYSRQNKRVFSLTQENHRFSEQMETQAKDLQRREQEEEIMFSQLEKARRMLEQPERDKGASEGDRRLLEIELDGLRKERQGLQESLRAQIEVLSDLADSADTDSLQKDRLRGVAKELARALESAVTSSYNTPLSSSCSSYSVTTSRDEIPGTGGVSGTQMDLRSLLEEVQQRARGSSLSVGATSRSRSSSISGSDKKLTERLNSELNKFKEQKDSLSGKISDLKEENQSISEKLLRENRQNELFRAELLELQRHYDQCVSRMGMKEQEAIRLNEQLDKLKGERDHFNTNTSVDDVSAFERVNPFSKLCEGHMRTISRQWSQDNSHLVHDENSFTMVSELTDPSATLGGLSPSLTANDTTAVLQAQIDETITSNLPPRLVPYSVQGPSPELEEPEESRLSAVSRLREERDQLEQKLQAAERDNCELRTQLSRAADRRPASQLFERISQMETEKQKLITENNQLREDVRFRAPSEGEGLQERNQHLSSKLVEAVRLLESNSKEKKALVLMLFGSDTNPTTTAMNDVTRRVDQIISERDALRSTADSLTEQLSGLRQDTDSSQALEGLMGEIAVLRERVNLAEDENLELTQHLADMVRERDQMRQIVSKAEVSCLELRQHNERLTRAHTQLDTEHEEVSAELQLAREAYAQVVEERDTLFLQNEQLTAQYMDAVECKQRVVEEHAVSLAQMDGLWRLRADAESPRARTPTHIWGEGWDRKTTVLHLSPKQDPAVYLAGGKGQTLLPNPNAIIVVDVLPSSPAYLQLHPGDIIESIDSCDCSLLSKSEVISKLAHSENSAPELVVLRRRGPHRLLVIPDVKLPSTRSQRPSSRNQLSSSASFPGSRNQEAPCQIPEPCDLLDNKISQISLTSSLASYTELQRYAARGSNPLASSLASQAVLTTEHIDVVLLGTRDSKGGFGFSYSWESQFLVSALTKTGAASSQLIPGDKIVKVNGVSVLQAKPSSVKRLIRNNKNLLKLSIVRSVIPGSSNVMPELNQDIFSDTEAIEEITHQRMAVQAQEKDYHSAGESKSEDKGFLRNRLSLIRSKKRRKSSVPVPVESDTEDTNAPSSTSALSKIKAVRVLRMKKKQASFREELEPPREDPTEDRRTYEDARHPLHSLAVEEVFGERKIDCPTTPINLPGLPAPLVEVLEPDSDYVQTRIKIQPNTPVNETTPPSLPQEASEEDRANSSGFLLARDACGRTTFRNLPDLDRKLANKRHSLTSAPAINTISGSAEGLQVPLVSRSAEMFVSKNQQLSPDSVCDVVLASQEHHQPQSELCPKTEKTSVQQGQAFRSISPLSLQRSLLDKKSTLSTQDPRPPALNSESSPLDSFLDEARALICPKQQAVAMGWTDPHPAHEYIRANFTIQGHQFLTVTEGTVYQILEVNPPHMIGFMSVAPIFPEEVQVREGHIPTEQTGREMLQNLKPSLDLRRLKVYSPVKLYKGPRPVLIFGPLSGEIGQQLEKAYAPDFVVCPKAFVRANDEQMKDQLCNDIAKGLILDLTANSQKSYMFFELDYVQAQIKEDKHSILNSSPKIIGQLKEKGIPAIAILIKARSPNTIMSFSSRGLSEKDCMQMFHAFEHIEMDLEPHLHASLMLVKMPVLVEQIREVIQREQGLPVWMNV